MDRVRIELERGKDDLAPWVKEDFNNAFASTDDEDVIPEFTKIISWVQTRSQFLDAAKAEFAAGADGWLIAYARVKNCVVVT